MAKGRKPRTAAVELGKWPIPAEDLLHFIESSDFTAAWGSLGLDDEDDLTTLQLAIMAGPNGPPVIQGTGGLRKIRFAPPRWQTGKSGALRICYVYFEEFGIVYLVVVYRKGEKDDLSPHERTAIRSYIQKIEAELRRRKQIT